MSKLLHSSNMAGWIGKHCETTAIKRVLDYYGYNLSEEMLFGISGGIGFIYWYNKNMKTPFIGAKNKTKEGAIQEICRKLKLDCEVKETKSVKRAHRYMLDAFEKEIPVIVNVDLALLKYTGVPEESHFGGHAVAVFGYDNEKSQVHIFDRGKNEVAEPIESFKLARGSVYKPFPPKNRIYIIQPPNVKHVSEKDLLNEKLIYSSIKESIDAMKYPEIKNKGISGFDVWVIKMKEWSEHFKGLDFLGNLMALYTNIVTGGTGGDAFRSMYAQFLRESADILLNNNLNEAAKAYEEAAAMWLEIAGAALPDSYPYLKQLKSIMYEKNNIFEQGNNKSVQKISELQKKENMIMHKAAQEAVLNQKDIIDNLCQQVKKCKKLEEDALICLDRCLVDWR